MYPHLKVKFTHLKLMLCHTVYLHILCNAFRLYLVFNKIIFIACCIHTSRQLYERAYILQLNKIIKKKLLFT